MTTFSKFGKGYIEIAQLSLGLLGGLFYCMIYFLSLLIKPLRKLITVYKKGAPKYSTLVMTSIVTFILAVVGLPFVIGHEKTSFETVGILFVFLFLFISPWIFLSLDLFAYYKRFRIDRRK